MIPTHLVAAAAPRSHVLPFHAMLTALGSTRAPNAKTDVCGGVATSSIIHHPHYHRYVSQRWRPWLASVIVLLKTNSSRNNNDNDNNSNNETTA